MEIIILAIVMMIGLIPCLMYWLIKKETKDEMLKNRFKKYAQRGIISNVVVLLLYIFLKDMEIRLIVLLVLLHMINMIFFKRNK